MIRIITDSSSDILQAEAKELKITLIPLAITFEDGNTYLDEIEISSDEYYNKLKTCKKPPSTSQIPLNILEEIYEDAKKKKETVLVMPLSSKLSGSYNTAVMVKNQGNYDNVYVYDTLSTVGALKMLVVQAVKMRDKNMPIEKILEELEKLRKKTRLFAMIDTLEFLRKGGRLSNAAAFIGGLLHFKPCIGVVEGEIPVLSKQIGTAKATSWIKERTKDLPIDYNYPVYFQFSGTPDRLHQLIDAMSSNPEKDKKESFYIGPVVGTHIGPGAMAITYVTSANPTSYLK